MRKPFHQIYMHLVWAVWDRLPLLTPEIADPIHACIHAECQSLRCEILAVGGVQDHVQLLVRIQPALAVSELVKQLKGSSSHLITHRIAPDLGFKWQGGYGAFSVSIADVPRIQRYIERQEEHHRTGDLQPEYEPE